MMPPPLSPVTSPLLRHTHLPPLFLSLSLSLAIAVHIGDYLISKFKNLVSFVNLHTNNIQITLPLYLILITIYYLIFDVLKLYIRNTMLCQCYFCMEGICSSPITLFSQYHLLPSRVPLPIIIHSTFPLCPSPLLLPFLPPPIT